MHLHFHFQLLLCLRSVVVPSPSQGDIVVVVGGDVAAGDGQEALAGPPEKVDRSRQRLAQWSILPSTP